MCGALIFDPIFTRKIAKRGSKIVKIAKKHLSRPLNGSKIPFLKTRKMRFFGILKSIFGPKNRFFSKISKILKISTTTFWRFLDNQRSVRNVRIWKRRIFARGSRKTGLEPLNQFVRGDLENGHFFEIFENRNFLAK